MKAQLEITSVANPRVKIWASLLTKKGRDKHGMFIVEGPHLVIEALRTPSIVPECVVFDLEKGISREVEEAAAGRADIEWIGVSKEIMEKCSDTVQPQGIFAVLPQSRGQAQDLLELTDSLIIVADGVQDPGNLGTIIRSADAVGADAVILGRGCVDVYNPKTVRSTMGSMFHLPVIEAELPGLLAEASERGIQLVSAVLDADSHCYALDYRTSTWFIVGNEAHGVSPEVERHVTHRVRIPMRGQAESLNVAMASAILLYEALRQRDYMQQAQDQG